MKTGAKSALFCALATVGIVCLPLGQAQAQTVFGTIQAFGDSYADIGNLFKVIGPSPFYPTGRPILPVPWATVWILGTAYVAWRIGDARFAILGAWLIAGLAGAALTNDTPALQRVAGMVPTLALIPALFVERVVSIGSRQPRAGRESASVFERPVLVNVAVGIFVVLIALETIPFYFGPYMQEARYYWFTLAGRYAQRLDPRRDAIYQLDVPEFYWGQGPALFLADREQSGWITGAVLYLHGGTLAT